MSVIAAYLTFFPVTVNTIRGLQSADPRALELMHSYAASGWTILWKLRVPSALPYLFAALKVCCDRERRRRDHRRGAVLDPGRARRRDHQLQPVLRHSSPRTSGRRISSRRCSASLLPRRRPRSRGSSSTARRSTSYEREARRLVRGLSKVFEQAGVTALEDIDLDVAQGRVRLAHRPVGLRQVDAAPHRRRHRRADRGRGDRQRQDGAASPARPRLRDRLPGPRPLRLAHGREEHRAAAGDARLGPRRAAPSASRRCSSSSS